MTANEWNLLSVSIGGIAFRMMLVFGFDWLGARRCDSNATWPTQPNVKLTDALRTSV